MNKFSLASKCLTVILAVVLISLLGGCGIIGNITPISNFHVSMSSKYLPDAVFNIYDDHQISIEDHPEGVGNLLQNAAITNSNDGYIVSANYFSYQLKISLDSNYNFQKIEVAPNGSSAYVELLKSSS